MKSKMKLAFAIIAVALMVMVAVVPMVGIFTSDSDAAVPADSTTIPTAKRITVKGNIYTVTGELVTTSTTVKITWGSSSQYEQTVTTASGSYEMVLAETSATNVKVFVYDPVTKTKVAEYGEKTFSSMTSGNTYNADFKYSYNKTSGIQFNVYGTTTVYATFGGSATNEIKVFYTLYNASDVVLSSNSVVLQSDGMYIDYPSTAVKFAVTKITVAGVDKKITTSATNLSGTTSVVSNQNIIAVSVGALALPGASFSITKATATDAEGTALEGLDAVSDSDKKIDANKEKTLKWFYTKSTTSGAEKAKYVAYKVEWDSNNIQTGTSTRTDVSADSWSVTYSAPAYAYYGVVQMADTNSNTVNMALTPSITEVGESSVSLNVYANDGYYIAMTKQTGTTPTAVKLKVTVPTFSAVAINGQTLDATTKTTEAAVNYTGTSGAVGTINVDVTGYTYVYSTITYGTNSNPYEKDISLKINGITEQASIFGAKMSGGAATVTIPKLTSAGPMTFGVFIKTGETINLSAGDGESFTLDAASSASYIVPKTWALTSIKMATKNVSVILKDGDGKTVTTIGTGNSLKMNFPSTTSNIYKAFGTATATLTYDSTDKVWTASVTKPYYSVADGKFYPTITNGDNKTVKSFASTSTSPLTYTDGMTLTELDTTYTVWLEDSTGAVQKGTNTFFTAAVYDAYKTEGGDILFGDARTDLAGYTVTIDKDSGEMTIVAPSSFVNKTIASSSVKTSVLVLVAQNTTLMLEDYYIFTTDETSGKVMTVTAATDSFTGKLVKLDNTTGVGGITVELYKGTASVTPIATSVTSSDDSSLGEFTLKSKEEIVYAETSTTDGFILRFTDSSGSYTFENYYKVYKSEYVLNTKFKTTADYYKISVEDLDGLAVTGGTLTVTTTTQTTGVAFPAKIDGTYANKMAISEGDVLSFTLAQSGTYMGTAFTNLTRTVPNHTVTAKEIAEGEISLTTIDSSYEVTAVDYNDSPIAPFNAIGTISVYKKIGSVYQDFAITNRTVKSFDNSSMVFVLPALSDDYDGYYATFTQASAANVYGFSVVKQELEAEETEIKSDSAITVVPIYDYNGNALIVSGTAPKISGEGGPSLAIYEGKLRFIQDYTALTYTIDWNGCKVKDIFGNEGYFTTTASQTVTYAVDYGFIGSAKMLLPIYVTDAVGTPLENGTNDGVLIGINEKTAAETVLSSTIQLDDGIFSLVATGADYDSFVFYSAALDHAGYSFDESENTVFAANEQTVVPKLYWANSENFDGLTDITAYNFKAYDADGDEISTAAAASNSMVVDIEEAVLYTATVTGTAVRQGINTFTFVGLTSDLYTSYNEVKGSLPIAADSNKDYILIQKYLEDVMVGSEKIALAQNDTSYVIYIDMSDYVDEDIAGIAFDSLVGTYVYKGQTYASCVIDPSLAFNNMLTPEQQILAEYSITLLENAINAGHMSFDVINNVAFLSADKVFYVADDESIYTDGQYKYTFAGWYVNGILASQEPEFFYPLVGDSTASAQYNVEYIKTSDVNKDVEKEYVNIVEKVEVPVEKTVGIDTNVLIIGICAVIVALIAVVYAVIKKD